MARVQFHHPYITRDLVININPDQVTWAYGLNTAVYPTYGGEVIQILSVYFDDMTIAGTVATYDELEAIYTWFITYMQYATQGRTNPSYDQHPVDFWYTERNWHFQIWPKSLPGFRYGRDVVAPTWQLTAAVKEPDAVFADQLKTTAAFNASATGQIEQFGATTADFGKTGDLSNNPWASPDADPNRKNQTIAQFYQAEAQTLADQFSHFVNVYQQGDINSLPQFASAPPYNGALGPTASKSSTKGKTK